MPPRRVRYHLSMPGVEIDADDGGTFRALVDRLLGRSLPENTTIPQIPTAAVGKAAPALTAKEREIALLICEGLTTPQIAARMTLGVGTIRTHRHNINKKLGSSSRAELDRKREQWDA